MTERCFRLITKDGIRGEIEELKGTPIEIKKATKRPVPFTSAEIRDGADYLSTYEPRTYRYKRTLELVEYEET